MLDLVDTHAHLDDEQLRGRLPELLEAARQAGVQQILCVGTTAETSRGSAEIATEYAAQGIYAAAGIHPNYCGTAAASDWQSIVDLLDHPRVVAIGETGLDRYWDDCPFPLQQDYFGRHLELSQRTDLPFIVHMRDCQADVLEMLREFRNRGPLRGVMHSFTGDLAGALECVELGLHLSFAGMVTYPKSTALREVAAQVPADRLLVETDSPYLSPHPHRSIRPNHPAMVLHTASCLAEVRGVPLGELARQVRQNVRELFRF